MSTDMLTCIDERLSDMRTRVLELQRIRILMKSEPDRFLPVVERAEQVFEDAWTWLTEANRFFNGRSPLRAVVDGDAQEVLRIIQAIEVGVYE